MKKKSWNKRFNNHKNIYISWGYSQPFSSYFIIIEIGTWHWVYCNYNKKVGR